MASLVRRLARCSRSALLLSANFLSSSFLLFRRRDRRLGRKIGGGGCASVYMARSVRNANDRCALKRIPHRHVSVPIELLREEGRIMARLNSPCACTVSLAHRRSYARVCYLCVRCVACVAQVAAAAAAVFFVACMATTLTNQTACAFVCVFVRVRSCVRRVACRLDSAACRLRRRSLALSDHGARQARRHGGVHGETHDPDSQPSVGFAAGAERPQRHAQDVDHPSRRQIAQRNERLACAASVPLTLVSCACRSLSSATTRCASSSATLDSPVRLAKLTTTNRYVLVICFIVWMMFIEHTVDSLRSARRATWRPNNSNTW